MKKIAIIEDDQLFHEALQRALKKAGYQVAGAFSIAQGYEVFKGASQSFDHRQKSS